MDIRIDAVFSLAVNEGESSNIDSKKVSDDAVANSKECEKVSPPTNEDMDAPPSLTLEDVLPYVGTLEGNVDSIAPPTLTPIPRLPQRPRQPLSAKIWKHQSWQGLESVYKTDNIRTNRKEIVPQYLDIQNTCKRIFPSYVCLTKVDNLLAGKESISYSKIRQLKVKECVNMCKKMQFTRQLRDGKNVFNVKLVKDPPDFQLIAHTSQDKMTTTSQGSVKCKRVQRRQVHKAAVHMTASETKLKQLWDIKRMVEQQRLTKRISNLAKKRNNVKIRFRFSPKSIRTETLNVTSVNEQLACTSAKPKSMHSFTNLKLTAAKTADKTKAIKSPSRDGTKKDSSEAPNVMAIVGRSGRMVKPNQLYSCYVTTPFETSEEKEDKRRFTKLRKMLKRQMEIKSTYTSQEEEEEFEFEVDNPEQDGTVTDVSEQLLRSHAGEKLKSFTTNTNTNKPKAFKRRNRMTPNKKPTIEILKDSTADDDNDIINTLLKDYESPSSKLMETATSTDTKTTIDDQPQRPWSQQFPHARDPLTQSKQVPCKSVAAEQKSVVPTATVTTIGSLMPPAVNPPVSVTTKHIPVLLNSKPDNPFQIIPRPTIIQHNGKFLVTYAPVTDPIKNASTNGESQRPQQQAPPVVPHSSGGATGVASARPPFKVERVIVPNGKTPLPRQPIQGVVNSNSTTTGLFATSSLSNAPTKPVASQFQVQPVLSSGVLHQSLQSKQVVSVARELNRTETRPATNTYTSSSTPTIILKYEVLQVASSKKDLPSSPQKIPRGLCPTISPSTTTKTTVSGLLRSSANPLSTLAVSSSCTSTISSMKTPLMTKIKQEPNSPGELVVSSSSTSTIDSTNAVLLTKIKQEPKSPGEQSENTSDKKINSTANVVNAKFYLIRINGKNIIVPMKDNIPAKKAYFVRNKDGNKQSGSGTGTEIAGTKSPVIIPQFSTGRPFLAVPNSNESKSSVSLKVNPSTIISSLSTVKLSKKSKDSEKRPLETTLCTTKSERPANAKNRDVEGSEPPAKKAAFSEGVTQREETLRQLKALLKEKQKAVDELRQSRLKPTETAQEDL